jgi:hypothetical protein
VIGYRRSQAEDAPQRTQMAKILLVEDNDMNRDMLSRRLVREGYEVVAGEDGAEGVAKAAGRLGGDPGDKGRPADRVDSGDRLDRPYHGERPANGLRGRLRRLRHQTHRDGAPFGKDRAALARRRVMSPHR